MATTFGNAFGLGSLRSKRKLDLILIGVGVVVAIALLFPLLQIVVLTVGSVRAGSLFESTGFTLANFSTVLADPDFVSTLKNTLWVGFGSVVIMLLWSVPFAWYYTRTDLPGRKWLLIFLTVKMAVPSFLVALGYIFLFNPSSGIANRLLMSWFDLADAPISVYTLGWIIFLQGSTLASPAFFMMVPTFKAIDAALEEAGRVSGIGQKRILFHVILPLTAPAVVATTIYYFIVAMEMFDYAALLGMPAQILVFSTWIFQIVNPQVDEPRYDLASAIGVLFTAMSILLVFVYFWTTRRAERFAVVTGKRGHQNVIRLSPTAKIVAWVLIGAFAMIEFVIPVLMLFWASLMPFLQPPSIQAFKSITFDAYITAFDELPLLLKNTGIVMLAVPTISVLFALCLSWVVVRSKFRARKAIDVVIMAAIGIPSIVGALTFLYLGLATYSYLPIYTTIWIIVLAMSTRYLTWGTRTINAAMLQLHNELEEACSVSGIGIGRTFFSVVVPIIAPALLFSWFWIALLSLRELTIPILLARDNTQVLSTAIFGFKFGGSSSVAAAMGMILLVIVLVMVLIFQKIIGRKNL